MRIVYAKKKFSVWKTAFGVPDTPLFLDRPFDQIWIGSDFSLMSWDSRSRKTAFSFNVPFQAGEGLAFLFKLLGTSAASANKYVYVGNVVYTFSLRSKKDMVLDFQTKADFDSEFFSCGPKYATSTLRTERDIYLLNSGQMLDQHVQHPQLEKIPGIIHSK